MTSEQKVVIPTQKPQYFDIVKNLRSILSNLHWCACTCSTCGWVAHEDDRWYGCADCGNRVCELCYDEYGNGSKTVYCEQCDNGNGNDVRAESDFESGSESDSNS